MENAEKNTKDRYMGHGEKFKAQVIFKKTSVENFPIHIRISTKSKQNKFKLNNTKA